MISVTRGFSRGSLGPRLKPQTIKNEINYAHIPFLQQTTVRRRARSFA